MSEKKEKRSVNWQQLGRIMVCLILVCVILVNCSPIRAKAVEPVTMVMVSAASVIASVMIGIGVMMGQNREAFDQVVQMVQGSNALKDFIQKDETNTEVIPLYRSPGNGGVGSGALSLLVAGALIETIRQVLFDEEVVTEPAVSEGYASYNGIELPILSKVSGSSSWSPYTGARFIVYSDYWKQYWCYSFSFSSESATTKFTYYDSYSGSDFPYLVLPSSYSFTRVAAQTSYWDKGLKSDWSNFELYSSGLVWSSFDVYDSSGTMIMEGSEPVVGTSINLLDGLSAGEIAPQEQELSEGYSDWVAGSQWDVNNSQWWPVAVGQTYDETVGFTQEQVQAGEGTYIIADSPVYNTNLPLAGSLTYERFAIAQPLTVSASVTDGGTIRYEWFRYQMEPSLGASESVGEGLSIVPDTSNVGKWTYYCKATNTVSGVSSLPVTSNYCTVTIIDPNEQENPDISPTEAPSVDPDPGGDPDPGVDPDIDPDNQTDLENSGNENVDHLIEIIPDHSGEFGEALKALADSMSYEGTDAILTIPQVNFPALGNLVPGFVMMEEQQINFADYVEMMPSNLLLLVRCLLTAALIMYCFYELYSAFEYALVLRRD